MTIVSSPCNLFTSFCVCLKCFYWVWAFWWVPIIACKLLCTIAHLESHPLTTCFIDHSLMCLAHFFPFCSTPTPTTPISLPMTGVRRSACATLQGDSLAVRSNPLVSQVISQNSASTSAVSTRRSISRPGKQLQPWEWLDDHSRSLRTFSSTISSQHSVASTVPTWLSPNNGNSVCERATWRS